MKHAAGSKSPARRKWARRGLWIAGLVLASAAFLALSPVTPLREHNFSQYPGFNEYFAAHPPLPSLPSLADRALLRKHRPRFYLPKDHAGLIGFYEDYIGQGELRNADGRQISSRVTQSILNAYKDDPGVRFTHRAAPGRTPAPVIFGRIERNSLRDETGRSRRLTFLTYHAVFRHSGVVAGLSRWQSLLLAVVGNLDDWHQLDHYTAATVVLDESERPVALMLQQHNYQRSYIYAESLSLPEDGRPRIDIALRSNELYPHRKGRQRRRAVAFLDPDSFRYMLGLATKPFRAADDITNPDRQASYALRFLPQSDAFYTFKGFLGERRRLPGRNGPPGADYNTLPHLKPLSLQLLSGYWRNGHEGDQARLQKALESDRYLLAFAKAQAAVFLDNLQCAGRKQRDCRFR